MKLLRAHILLHFPAQLEKFQKGCGMEQIIASLPENKSQFLVIVGHRLGQRTFLGHVHEPVDIFDGFERLLPKLHLDGRVQLEQTRLRIQLLRFRLGNGHVGHLRSQLADIF